MSSPYVAGNGLPANKLTYQLDCQVKSGDFKVELIDGTLRPVNSTLYLIHNFQTPSPTSYTNIPGVDGIYRDLSGRGLTPPPSLQINRSDTNQQYFNLSMSQNLNLVSVKSHKFYYFENDTILPENLDSIE